MIPTKNPRNAILYVRVKKENRDWVKAMAKQLGYKSESEFVDLTIDGFRKQSQSDRKSPGVSKRR